MLWWSCYFKRIAKCNKISFLQWHPVNTRICFHMVWFSCWNRKLSHRFLGLFDCFIFYFILCGNSTEFPEQPVHHSQCKWFQSNLERVNRRAYDKNLSKRCSVQTVERVRVLLRVPCVLIQLFASTRVGQGQCFGVSEWRRKILRFLSITRLRISCSWH